MSEPTKTEDSPKPEIKLYDPHAAPERSFDDRLFDAPPPAEDPDEIPR